MLQGSVRTGCYIWTRGGDAVELPVIQEPMAVDVSRCLEDIYAEANARVTAQHHAIMARDNRPMVEFKDGDFVLLFTPAGKTGKVT